MSVEEVDKVKATVVKRKKNSEEAQRISHDIGEMSQQAS